MATKFLHQTNQSLAGRDRVVALCGRLVGRLSIVAGPDAVGIDSVTCERCKQHQKPRLYSVASVEQDSDGDPIVSAFVIAKSPTHAIDLVIADQRDAGEFRTYEIKAPLHQFATGGIVPCDRITSLEGVN